MRRLAWIGGVAALVALVVAGVRRLLARPDPNAWEVPAPGFADTTPTTVPVEPKPASEADQADREIESRLDPDLRYRRELEDEEAARADAAERLRDEFAAEATDAEQPA